MEKGAGLTTPFRAMGRTRASLSAHEQADRDFCGKPGQNQPNGGNESPPEYRWTAPTPTARTVILKQAWNTKSVKDIDGINRQGGEQTERCFDVARPKRMRQQKRNVGRDDKRKYLSRCSVRHLDETQNKKPERIILVA